MEIYIMEIKKYKPIEHLLEILKNEEKKLIYLRNYINFSLYYRHDSRILKKNM